MENKNYGENRENEKSFKKHLFLFLKNNILLVGAVFAFILMTAAWFVNNSRVQAGSATVSATADRKFELAAVGTTGKYDDILKSILGDIVQDGDEWSSTGNENNIDGRITSNDKGDIVWVMSGGQNGQNLNNNTDNSTGTIEPGNSGKLEFYVLPKDTSAHEFSFTLTVKGYYGNNGSYSPMSSKENDFEKFYKLLSGHIQFFSSYDGEKYSNPLTATATAEGITLTGLTRSTTKNETQEKVTIYWVWPYYVGDMILPDGNGKLSNNEKNALFTDDLRSAIAGEMTGGEYSKYFENPIDDKLKGPIADMVNGNIDETAYNVIYTAYNNADKYIGENGEYILVQLSAAMDN